MSTDIKIPKIIHQTWKDSDIPDVWKVSESSWRDLAVEDGWEYKLWTDDSNLEFLSENYPWAVDFYNRLNFGIQRSHLMRYFYMYHFGGIYVDLDVVPKPERIMDMIDSISKVYSVMLSTQRHPDGNIYISTSFMMSVPTHPFWDKVIHELVEKTDMSSWNKMWVSTFRHYEVVMKTGGWFLTSQWDAYRSSVEDVTDMFVMPDVWLRPTGVDRSNFVTLVDGGPTWRDWDSKVAEYGQVTWKYRDIILLGIVFSLILVIILTLTLRRS